MLSLLLVVVAVVAFVFVFWFLFGFVFVFFCISLWICIYACCCSYMWHMHLSDQVVLFSQGFSVRTQVAQSQFTNIAHIWTWSDGWMGDTYYVQIQICVVKLRFSLSFWCQDHVLSFCQTFKIPSLHCAVISGWWLQNRWCM